MVNKRGKKLICSFELFLLITFSISLAFILGNEIEVVSAYTIGQIIKKENLPTGIIANTDGTFLFPDRFTIVEPKDDSNFVVINALEAGERSATEAGSRAPLPSTLSAKQIKTEVKNKARLEQINKDLGEITNRLQTSEQEVKVAQESLTNYETKVMNREETYYKTTHQNLKNDLYGKSRAHDKLRKQYDKLAEQEKELSGVAETPDSETPAKDKGESPGSIMTGLYAGKVFGKYGAGVTGLGPLIAGAAWGFSVALGLKALEGFLGVKKETIETLQISVLAGSLGGGAIKSIFEIAGKKTIGKYSAKAISQFAGAAIAIGVFLATYKKEKTEIVTFTSLPWQPPTGGRY